MKSWIVAALAVWGVIIASPTVCHAVIMPGYNLLQLRTNSFVDLDGPGSESTNAPPIELMGVPLGTFDFGGTIGVQNVGDTHAIIERKNPFTPNTSDTVDIELVALSLRSVDPISLNNKPHDLFVTLSPSNPSVGVVSNIVESGGTGTADATGTVFVDVTFVDIADPSQTIKVPLSDTLTGQAAFSTTPSPGELIITGVNDQNPGVYFAKGNISLQGPFLGVNLSTTVIPEPATSALLGAMGLVCLASRRRRSQAR